MRKLWRCGLEEAEYTMVHIFFFESIHEFVIGKQNYSVSRFF